MTTPSHVSPADAAKRAKLHADLMRERAQRAAGYRERALRIYPHVCARCGRGFEGRRLRELTVHHKDHNHDYNPPDGSNWELLCLYCHDDEHEKHLRFGYGGQGASPGQEPPSCFQPFEGLDALVLPAAPNDEAQKEPPKSSVS